MSAFFRRIALRAASMARTDEGRQKLLMVILIPFCIITVAISMVAYIISSPFAALKEVFGGDEQGIAESIWDTFNATPDTAEGAIFDFVYYSQNDPKWSKQLYSGGTISSHGCGPTSLAMVISTFTQDDKYNPSWMAQYLTDAKQADPVMGTYHSAFAFAVNAIAENEKIEMTIKEYSGTQWPDVAKEMEKSNVLVIARVSGGKWTSGSGHFIVLHGFDEGGNIKVGDPASIAKSQLTHTPSSISTAASKYWVITGPMYPGGGEYNWPFHGNFSVNHNFWRAHSRWACGHHTGEDFNANPDGQLVYSIGPGTVIVSTYDSKNYGNTVRIMHPDGYISLYAHMTERLVKVGDAVTSNTPLGHEGETGKVTGAHLHLEIHKNKYSYPKRGSSSPPASLISPLEYLKWHGLEL